MSLTIQEEKVNFAMEVLNKFAYDYVEITTDSQEIRNKVEDMAKED